MKDDCPERWARVRIKENLKRGLKELDDEIHEVIRRYERGEIELEQYLKLRVELEFKRIRIVMENLRRLSKAR